MQALNFKLSQSLSQIRKADWQKLTLGHPTLHYDFLGALHESQSVCPQTGWSMMFPTAWIDNQCVGAMPCYLKNHSYGEYVFDWSWANAYEQTGLAYYPKLLVAIPFTPVQGPRILGHTETIRKGLVKVLLSLEKEANLSSIHCLFPTQEDANLLQTMGFLTREGVQFHWQNQNFQSFDDFLMTMNHEKRKKIKQERKKIHEQSITFKWLTGSAIKNEHWQFLEDCYRSTYYQHGSQPYLNHRFFELLEELKFEHACLIVAIKDGRMIACAFNLFNENKFFGRYWGAIEYVPGLHFETCYYQSIQFCIANSIKVFEGGAQGEHKLARGLNPIKTQSLHHIKDARFAQAIEDFLIRESEHVVQYHNELNEHAPFKK